MKSSLILPFGDWPASDRQMWFELFRNGGLLDEQGRLAHLRATTQNMLRNCYGRWLGWLSRRQAEALLAPPAQRATPKHLLEWLDDLAHTKPTSRHMLVGSVLWVLKNVTPDGDWRIQGHLLKQLDQKARLDHGQRKQGRVFSSEILLQAGLCLAEGADRASTPLKAAKDHRDGAMVALLALMPIRRRAFVELALGTSFWIGHNHIELRLTGDMTKNGMPWEAPVPDQLHPVLLHYVKEVRPWLLSRGAQSHNVLWVDNRGEPYRNADYFGRRICSITERKIGVKVSPHLFRDAAATTLARRSPKNAQLVRALLGHASFGIVEKHYNHAKAVEAGRDYADVISSMLAG